MLERSSHHIGLESILVSCQRESQPYRDRKFLSEKKKELKRIQREMKIQFAKLRSAQEGESQNDPNEDLALTGINFKEKGNSLDGRMGKVRIDSERKRPHLTKHKSAKTQHASPKNKGQEKSPEPLSETLSLPKMIHKIRSEKQPKNASKNPSISRKKSINRGKDDLTYEQIRSQRKKQEENRHLTILGKVMFQNYRKQVKLLENRRKLFIREKYPQ